MASKYSKLNNTEKEYLNYCDRVSLSSPNVIRYFQFDKDNKIYDANKPAYGFDPELDGFYQNCQNAGKVPDSGRWIEGYTQIFGNGYGKALKHNDHDGTTYARKLGFPESEDTIGKCRANWHRWAYKRDWNADKWETPPSQPGITLGIPTKRLDCCITKEGGTVSQATGCPPDLCVGSQACKTKPTDWCIPDKNYIESKEDAVSNDSIYNKEKIEHVSDLLNDSQCETWANKNDMTYRDNISGFLIKISELLSKETDEELIKKYIKILEASASSDYARNISNTASFNSNMRTFCNGDNFNWNDNNYEELFKKYGKVCNCYWDPQKKGNPPNVYSNKIKELENMDIDDNLDKLLKYANDLQVQGSNQCWFAPCINDTDLIPTRSHCPSTSQALCLSIVDFKNYGTITAEQINIISECIASVEKGDNPFPEKDEDINSCSEASAPDFGISELTRKNYEFACNDRYDRVMEDKEDKPDIIGCQFCDNDRSCRDKTENNKDNICDGKDPNKICNLSGFEKLDDLINKCKETECDWCSDGNASSLKSFMNSDTFIDKNKNACEFTNITMDDKWQLEDICNYAKTNNYNKCEWCDNIDLYIEEIMARNKEPEEKKDNTIMIIIYVALGIVGLIIFLIIIYKIISKKNTQSINYIQ